MRFHAQQRAVATASLSQVRRPMYNSSLDAWRRYEARLAPLLAGLSAAVREDRPWRTARWPDQPSVDEWAAMGYAYADGATDGAGDGAAGAAVA